MNISSIIGFRQSGTACSAITSIKANSRQRISILTAMLAVFLLLSPVWAATITVNTSIDEDDSGGNCSVREALGSIDFGSDIGGCTASGTYGTSDTVILQSGETYLLSGGHLEISADVIIDGQGATIEGSGVDRVFYVCPTGSCSSTVTINHLTITNGKPTEGNGGGIYNNGTTLTLTDSTISTSTSSGTFGSAGGGIYNNNGTLTLIGSTISICRARSGTGQGYGGGIYNSNGTLTLTDSSTIADNTAELGDGAGIYNDGGTVTLNNSTLRDNATNGHGGGIYSFNGTATITGSTIISNFAAWYGGGIYIDGGEMTLTDSSIDSNTADVYGGGLANWGTVILNNSTISNNTATSSGGGIYNDDTLYANNITISGNMTEDSGGGIYQSAGQMELYNATVSNNTTNLGTGGGTYISSGLFNIFNSIIAGNTDGSGTTHHDCDGTLVSGGYNLIQDTTGCTGMVGTDITGTKPLLSALADNGGSTTTHALQSGSPAIDAGNPTGCVDSNVNPLTTDQRGVSRPLDSDNDGTASCDIGAYEFALPPDIDVTDSVNPADDLQINFPETNPNAKSPPAIVTISNKGQLPLTVSNIGFFGIGSGEFTYDLEAGNTPCHGLAIVLNPGQDCTLSIVFSPHWVGDKGALLAITSNDPDEGTVNITLAGIGVAEEPPADGGGCSLRSGAPFDPLLPLLIGLALIYLKSKAIVKLVTR